MKRVPLFLSLVLLLCPLVFQESPAQRGDPPSSIQEVISSGASSNISDGNVIISGTIGQAVVGVSTAKASEINHGFWHPLQRTAAVSGDVVVDNIIRLSNTPNPFTETTTVSYYLSKQSNTQLRIYSLTGHLVNILVDEVRSEGSYQTLWDRKDMSGKEVATGYYIYTLHAESVDAETSSIKLHGIMQLVQ